jgi:hypothetical protein
VSSSGGLQVVRVLEILECIGSFMSSDGCWSYKCFMCILQMSVKFQVPSPLVPTRESISWGTVGRTLTEHGPLLTSSWTACAPASSSSAGTCHHDVWSRECLMAIQRSVVCTWLKFSVFTHCSRWHVILITCALAPISTHSIGTLELGDYLCWVHHPK